MRYMGFMNGSYRGRRREGICAMPDYVKLNAWDVGVRAEPGKGSGPDRIEVYMTGGSHDAHGKVLLGTIVNTLTGPCWEPAVRPESA